MRKAIDAWALKNEVLMSRELYSGSFVIVEGFKDGLILEKFFAGNKCEILVANNKKNAIKAYELLKDENYTGILVIIDNDFWFLEKKQVIDSNILYTDSYDMETMIIQSKALENYLRESVEEAIFNTFISSTSKNIRELLLENAKYIGYLRYHSHINKISAIVLKNIKYNRFIGKTDLSIDIKKFIEESIIKRCKNKINNEIIRLIEKILKEIEKKNFDLWHVCSGHDLVNILAIGLKNIFGNKFVKNLNQNQLERGLRLSYEFRFFCRTRLFNSIKNWEENNNGYIIFSNTN